MRLFCIALFTAVTLAGCGQKSFVQKGSSMEPTIKANEVVRVNMDAYRSSSPQRWDVIAFTPPVHSVPAGSISGDLGIWIFRIVGTPGDIISFDDTGVLINGSSPIGRPASIADIPYKRTTASGVPARPRSPIYPLTIPDGQYFMLGDNPDHANDSRLWGLLSEESILGKVANK